jgi:hypothetical protein
MADGFIAIPAVCEDCQRLGALPVGLLGCGECALIRMRLVAARHELELLEAREVAEEFPLSVWREWCAAGVDLDADDDTCEPSDDELDEEDRRREREFGRHRYYGVEE